MLVRFLLFIALLTVGTTAKAEWSIEEVRDEKTAEKILSATSTNGDGYRVDIFRSEDNAVRWQLSLPSASFDRIVDDGLLALFRVDDCSVTRGFAILTVGFAANGFATSLENCLCH